MKRVNKPGLAANGGVLRNKFIATVKFLTTFYDLFIFSRTPHFAMNQNVIS